MKIINPSDLPIPPSYSHAIELPLAQSRLLVTAGQVGIRPDGSIPSAIEIQTRLVFQNLESVLRAARMGFEHVIKTTTFLTDPDDFTGFSKARSELFGALRPASTLIYVSRLFRPELRVEVEVIAAKAD